MACARIAVVGLWHLGCVAAASLARLGHTVRATDFDAGTLGSLLRGVLPVYEPGLAELIDEQMGNGRLDFLPSCQEAFAGADFIFITFDTPVGEEDQSDLSPILAAFEAIAEARGAVEIVVMSQVPVGTCHELAEQLCARAPQLSFSLVYHPENLRLGEALETFLQPDFLLVGADDPAAAERLLGLYSGVAAPCLTMSIRSAEMTKHALNAYLATSISFVNELASLAETCGADVRDVVRALRHDRRIGPRAFLSPGPGFSGGTLGRDVQSLRRLGERSGRKTLQLDATLAVNAERLPALREKIRRACGGLQGICVGLLGLTYKPGTNTLRRSHAIDLARLLLSAGAHVQAFDPCVTQPRPETHGITLCADAYQAAESADAMVIMTPWPEFQKLDLTRLRRAMRQGVLIDAHNCLDDRAARRAGFQYSGIGIPDQFEERNAVGVAQ